jgi:hypothetical protein
VEGGFCSVVVQRKMDISQWMINFVMLMMTVAQ